MPHRLKIRTAGTDARGMSETALTPTDETPTIAPASMLLDSDAPRLGSVPLTVPTPIGGGLPSATDVVHDATPVLVPSAPGTPPVLGTPAVQAENGGDVFGTDLPAPSIPAPALPTLPAAGPVIPSSAAQLDEGADAEPAAVTTGSEHPMAHLMGGATKVSAASQRAAEIRAAKKAKAKKMKIGFVIGALVFAAVVGPPVWSWFTNALDESGTTSTEEPAD